MPALVALLGVVAAGLLLAVSVSSSPSSPAGSPAAAIGSPTSSAAPASPVSPVPTAATPSVSPSMSPAGSATPTAWPPRPALPAGWAYELACDDEGSQCRLHLRDAAGAERPGWPVRINGTCWNEQPAGGPDGTAYLACYSGAPSLQVVVHAFRLDGNVPAGWPVRLKGDPGGLEVAPNGTVYVGALTSNTLRIHALGPNGTPRPGWPRKLPGVGGSFTVAPDGAVVAMWYEGVAEDAIGLVARGTRYTTIGPDGKTRRGWPIRSTGTASAPVVGRDGTVYYVSATLKVYGHDRKGRIVKGWPYQLRAATSTYAGPEAPLLRDDGRLMFVGEAWDEDGEYAHAEVTVLTTSGRPARGWPYRTRGSIDGPGCSTPSWPSPLFDLTADGTLYLAPWDGERATAVALDADGRMMPGWPRRLHPGWMPTSITVLPGGGAEVAVADVTGLAGACGEGAPQTVALGVDGSVRRDVGVSTFAEVYRALRPQRLRAAAGTAPFAAGQPIELMWSLVNTSPTALVLPYASHWGDDDVEWAHLAGVEHLWLERLEAERTIPCISSDRRRGAWYAVGGRVVGSAAPVTIPAGAGLERRMAIGPELSACLPPGAYRVHLELHRLGYDVDMDVELGGDEEFEPIGVAALDTRIAGPAATPTPLPTRSPSPPPRPTPTPTASVPPVPSPVP